MFQAAGGADISGLLENKIKIVFSINEFALVKSKDGMEMESAGFMDFGRNKSRANLRKNFVRFELENKLLWSGRILRHVSGSK